MQDTETSSVTPSSSSSPTPEQADLLHNAQTAQKLREHLKSEARSLKIKDISEIIDKLKAAFAQGEAEIRAAAGQAEHVLASMKEGLDNILRTQQEAHRLLERKEQWEKDVEPNIRLITAHAAQASNLHRHLREKRRELKAREVEAIRNQLIQLEQEAMAAWGAVRDRRLAVALEHRLHRATEATSNALKDAEGTLQRKKQWEDAVAANESAVEAELKRVLGLVVSHYGPLPSAAGSDAEAPVSAEATEAGAEGTDASKAHGKAPDLSRQFRKIEELLKNRRPMDRNVLQRMHDTLQALIAHTRGQAPAAAQAPAPTEHRRASREEIRTARNEVESVLAQAEAALGLTWVPRHNRATRPEGSKADSSRAEELASPTVAGEAQHDHGDGGHESSHDTAALEASLDAALAQVPGAEDHADHEDDHDADMHAEGGHDDHHDGEHDGEHAEGAHAHGADEAHAHEGSAGRSSAGPSDEHGTHIESSEPTEPLKMGAIKNIQSLLNRAREILDAAIIPGAERKALWARFRNASDTLRRHRNVSRSLELDGLRTRVAEIRDMATQVNPARTRKLIQEVQKMVVESPLTRGERDELLQALRDAWSSASNRQEELKEVRKQKEESEVTRLGEHFLRWESRRDGITGLLQRLEVQLEEINLRKKNSTSIGYKVLAEKRLLETRERIQELKIALEEILEKISDVGPRLKAAGWEPPSPEERARMQAEAAQNAARGQGDVGRGRDDRGERREPRRDARRDGPRGGGNPQGGRGDGGRGDGGRGDGGRRDGGRGPGGRGDGGRRGGPPGGSDRGAPRRGGQGENNAAPASSKPESSEGGGSAS